MTEAQSDPRYCRWLAENMPPPDSDSAASWMRNAQAALGAVAVTLEHDERALRHVVRSVPESSGLRASHPRFAHIVWATGMSETDAAKLCERFGEDPYEKLPVRVPALREMGGR